MEYLIKDYGTKDAKNEPAKLRTVHDGAGLKESLWRELEDAKRSGQLIAVYPIPDCVIDWS